MAIIINSFKGNSMVGLKSAFIGLFDQTRLIGWYVPGQGVRNNWTIIRIIKKRFLK